MRPVMPNNKLSYKLWILYAVIFIICVAGIAVALSKIEYFEDENLERAFGFIDKDAQKEDENVYYFQYNVILFDYGLFAFFISIFGILFFFLSNVWANLNDTKVFLNILN